MMIIGGALLIVSTALMASSKYPAADKRGEGKQSIASWPKLLVDLHIILAGIHTSPTLFIESVRDGGVRYDYFTVTAAATVLPPLFSGIGRPIMGFISDSWGGRRNAILAEISMLAVATPPLVLSGLPVLYIAAAGLVGFLGGAMMTLYASLIGDRYGTSSSTFLFGIIYNGKFVAAVLASVLFAS